MKFQLFLNHLSASQTIKQRDAKTALDCYATCSPYNCAIISIEQNQSEPSLRSLFERMMKWKFRREKFGHLVYDPSNNRLYETDEEGYTALGVLLRSHTYESFCDTLRTNRQCGSLFSLINAVYI